MRTLTFALLFLLASAVSYAGDLDGKWSGSITTDNGPVQVDFVFKTDGASLTGTSTGPDGSVIQIKNGKITGDKIAFDLAFDMQGTAMTFNYTGVVSGGEIKLHTEFMGMPFDYSVKKVP
jgi:hypothetical protein